jgi:hypothetical protein
MNRVIPKYIPANAVEDKLGYLVTAVDQDAVRLYLSRGGFQWGPIEDAEFFGDPLNAADSIKAMKEQASGGDSPVSTESIQLVRVIGIMIPTVISETDLRKRRRAAALKKLTEEEIEALGLGKGEEEGAGRQKRRA